MERMIFPIEEPGLETMVYDVGTVIGQAFGVPNPFDFAADVEAILAPLYEDVAIAHAGYMRGE